MSSFLCLHFLPNQIKLFESTKTSIDKNQDYILEENVLLVSAYKFFLADFVRLDKEKNIAYLRGHVLGVMSNKILIAEEAEIH